MKISSRVEPLVRSALDAAVQRDFLQLDAALKAFPDDQTTKQGIELVLAITLYIMHDMYRGKPSEAETRAVAAEIARAESWVEPTEAEITEFLLRLVSGEPFAPSVPSENVFILGFVSAANLLSSCRRDDEEWWNHLDRAEAAIEAV